MVTFGSPSAAKAWVAVAGETIAARRVAREREPMYVCIGETSATACEKLGLADVWYPDAPGMDAWAETVVLALNDDGVVPR